MSEIFVRTIKLPAKIKGYTAIDSEGNYNIYINQDLDEIMKLKTYNHELTHITRNDWAENKTLDEAEMFI